MYLVLGILIGLSIAILVVLSTKRFQHPIERKITQIENKFKEKGEVFVDTDEAKEMESFLAELPTNNLE